MLVSQNFQQPNTLPFLHSMLKSFFRTKFHPQVLSFKNLTLHDILVNIDSTIENPGYYKTRQQESPSHSQEKLKCTSKRKRAQRKTFKYTDQINLTSQQEDSTFKKADTPKLKLLRTKEWSKVTTKRKSHVSWGSPEPARRKRQLRPQGNPRGACDSKLEKYDNGRTRQNAKQQKVQGQGSIQKG